MHAINVSGSSYNKKKKSTLNADDYRDSIDTNNVSRGPPTNTIQQAYSIEVNDHALSYAIALGNDHKYLKADPPIRKM